MKAVKPGWGNLGRQKTANPEDGGSATDHAMGMALMVAGLAQPHP